MGLVLLMTQEVGGTIAPFVHEDVVGRVAESINFFICKLAGPELKKLGLADSAKYGFHPKTLFSSILKIFLSMSRSDEFLEAVANDEGYKQQVFRNAAVIARRRNIFSQESDCVRFEHVVERLEQIAARVAEEVKALGEPPTEFVDELFCIVMKKPMILPDGHRIERSCVLRAIAEKKQNPYNRAPLTRDMLKEDVELRARIEEWRKAKLGPKSPPP